MDVSDRKTQVFVMAKKGRTPKIVMETTIPTSKDGLAKFLAAQERSSPVAGTRPVDAGAVEFLVVRHEDGARDVVRFNPLRAEPDTATDRLREAVDDVSGNHAHVARVQDARSRRKTCRISSHASGRSRCHFPFASVASAPAISRRSARRAPAFSRALAARSIAELSPANFA